MNHTTDKEQIREDVKRFCRTEQAANILVAYISTLLTEARIKESKLYKQYFRGRTEAYANARIAELKGETA